MKNKCSIEEGVATEKQFSWTRKHRTGVLSGVRAKALYRVLVGLGGSEWVQTEACKSHPNGQREWAVVGRGRAPYLQDRGARSACHHNRVSQARKAEGRCGRLLL